MSGETFEKKNFSDRKFSTIDIFLTIQIFHKDSAGPESPWSHQ
jgi:hypothetical protein